MKRSVAIEQMSDFLESVPEEASSYHFCDMLLDFLEKQGIASPPEFTRYMTQDEVDNLNLFGFRRVWTVEDTVDVCEWEEE